MIYDILGILVENLRLVMAVSIGLFVAICSYFILKLRANIKDSKRTWDKDKYRKY